MSGAERVDLLVVGGGITGLAAAWEAHRQGASVVVVEASERAGGKLRTSPLAGIPLDEAADAFLARVPEGIELCRELGIDGELVSPSTGRAFVWSQGALRPLPSEQLLGVPTDLDAVAATGILSPAGLARARQDLDRQPAAGANGRPGASDDPAADDQSVGALIRERLGDEVLDRLVGPLIGGIWAGDCDRLSLEVAAPQLAEASRRHPSLIRGAAALRAAAPAQAQAAATGTPAAAGAGVGGSGHSPDADEIGRGADDHATSGVEQAGAGTRASAAETGGRERSAAQTPGRNEAGSGRQSPPGGPAPVFLAPRDGMGRLVEVLVTALADRVRTGQRVVGLEPERTSAAAAGRWRVTVEASDAAPAANGVGRGGDSPTTASPGGLTAGATAEVEAGRAGRRRPGDRTVMVADRVVIATPAFAAAPLVGVHSPEAAEILAGIEYASIALVALAVPREGIDRPLDGSGFLVPPSEGRLLTACSWTSSKWGHLAGDGSVALLRASAGRDGDQRALSRDDGALVRALLDDLRDTMGLRAEPIEARVSRWPRSFPQPRPGHLARVDAAEAALSRDAPGLAVAGAWMRGVGIPACVRHGRRAASALLAVRSSAPR